MKRRLKNKLPRHVNYRLAVFQEHDFKNKQTQTNKQTTKIAKENVRKNETSTKPNPITTPSHKHSGRASSLRKNIAVTVSLLGYSQSAC